MKSHGSWTNRSFVIATCVKLLILSSFPEIASNFGRSNNGSSTDHVSCGFHKMSKVLVEY